MSRSVPTRLTVYGRRDCHLCEEMVAGLAALQARFSFAVDVVDVDREAVLAQRHGEHVPVLMHGEHELCRHRLQPGIVTDYLAQLG